MEPQKGLFKGDISLERAPLSVSMLAWRIVVQCHFPEGSKYPHMWTMILIPDIEALHNLYLGMFWNLRNFVQALVHLRTSPLSQEIKEKFQKCGKIDEVAGCEC